MTRRLLFTSDWHIPNEDASWLGLLAEQIIPDIQPDIIVLGGDMLTCGSVSKYLKAPGTPNLADERAVAVQWLGRVRDAMPGAQMVFLEGNHERRLVKRLWQEPGLGGLEELTIPALLNLRGLACDWLPETEPYRVGGLTCVHGDTANKWAGYTASNKLHITSGSLIVGHCHRLAIVTRMRSGTRIQAAEAGCGCEWALEGYLSSPPDWHKGAVLAHVGEGWTDLQLISYNGSVGVCGAQTWPPSVCVCDPIDKRPLDKTSSLDNRIKPRVSPFGHRILDALLDGPLDTGEMASAVGRSTNWTRKTLRRLEAEGVVCRMRQAGGHWPVLWGRTGTSA